jgi:ArsR family transcriptional regulator, virulence genes transcriptional regulator
MTDAGCMAASKRATKPGPELMRARAGEAARLMRAVGNENRLVVLCALAEGELSVGELLERIDLSQSALSQHLAVLRREALVDTRREAQTIYYRLSSNTAARLIEFLYEQYCC